MLPIGNYQSMLQLTPPPPHPFILLNLHINYRIIIPCECKSHTSISNSFCFCILQKIKIIQNSFIGPSQLICIPFPIPQHHPHPPLHRLKESLPAYLHLGVRQSHLKLVFHPKRVVLQSVSTSPQDQIIIITTMAVINLRIHFTCPFDRNLGIKLFQFRR